MIAITNNYFADLLAAREAGLIESSLNPNKSKLYELIEAHNASLETAISQSPVVADQNFQGLFQEWKEKQEGKKQFKNKALKAHNPFESRAYLAAKEVSELLKENSIQLVCCKLEKGRSYVLRAERAWRIYSQSSVAKELFESGNISWAEIHKVAGGEPKDWLKVENKLRQIAFQKTGVYLESINR